MRLFILIWIATFGILSILVSCNNKKETSNTEEVEEIVVNDDEFDETESKSVDRNKKSPVYKFLHDTVNPHSAKMRRYMKKDEFSNTIKTRVDSLWFRGNKPKYKTERKDLVIFHDGSVKVGDVVDGVTQWIGAGEVWIIYYSADAIRYNDFYIKGRVQEAINFPQKTKAKPKK